MKKICKNFWYIVLAVQIVILFFLNLQLSEANIDCDSAKLFVHAVEMSKNGTYLIPGWEYPSTLEMDTSLLLAMPLFGLIKNIYVAFLLANMVFLLLLIWAVFRLFGEERRQSAAFASILICIPYRIGMLDYMNMMFFNGSQYIIKVTLPLMLLSLLIYPYKPKTKDKWYQIKNVPYVLLFGGLLFVAGLSSGVYIAFCGLLPVIAGVFLWRIYNKQKPDWSFWCYSGMAAVMSVAGMLLNSVLQVGAKGNSMTLCNIYGELQDNVRACFWGIFELFGGVPYESTEVMTYEGINILARMFFVILLLVCAVAVLRKVMHQTAEETDAVLLAVFVWNTFILSICNTRYGSGTFEYRYHLIGAIPLLCLAANTLVQWYQHWEKEVRVGGIAIAALAVAFLSLTSYKSAWNNRLDYSNLQAVCDYTNEIGAEYAYFLYDVVSPEYCRLLDYEDAVYLQAMGDEKSYVCDYYAKYYGAPIIFDNAILVMENTIADLGDSMEMYGRVFERCNIIGTKSIYYDTGQ